MLIIKLNSMVEFIRSVKGDSEAFQVKEMKEKDLFTMQYLNKNRDIKYESPQPC